MNDDSTNASLERLSAFADGQLQGEELAQALDAACTDAQWRTAWQTYHLVGDVLRSGRHAPCGNAAAFVGRLQQRLALEVIEPPRVVPQPGAALHHVRAEAANEPVFRWKMVAGLASVAAAAAIGWAWIGSGLDAAPAGGQFAARQAPADVAQAAVPARVSVGGVPQIMLRDSRLDELLEAHQQTIGASQMPSGFLRNATFDGAAR